MQGYKPQSTCLNTTSSKFPPPSLLHKCAIVFSTEIGSITSTGEREVRPVNEPHGGTKLCSQGRPNEEYFIVWQYFCVQRLLNITWDKMIRLGIS